MYQSKPHHRDHNKISESSSVIAKSLNASNCTANASVINSIVIKNVSASIALISRLTLRGYMLLENRWIVSEQLRVKGVDVLSLIVKKNIVIAIIEELNVGNFAIVKIVPMDLFMKRCQARFDN